MNLRIIFMVFFPIFAVAQAPQKINFQSILRNSSGEVVSNSSVSLRISILSGTITGTLVYSETHAKTTDAGGLISLQIGGGTVSSGVFGNINWGSTSHYIKLEADFSGGSNYVVLGTQELMSVPYALYASKTDTSALNLTSRLATKLNATDTAYLSNRINAKVPINNPTFTGTVAGIDKTMVGLPNVDNTSDAGKPISTATQTALDLKAPINNPTFTGTVGGISKTMVGLRNVDNTTDAGKPVSTATQAALDLKAPINNPAFTGTVTGVTKAMVDLGNVDNTSDLNKTVSTATQTALDLKENASNKSDASLGTSTILYPTQNAVKTYVDLQVATGAPDATSSVKGKIQLTGELGGTASSPTVPGLAQKAPINSPAFTGTVTGVTKTMVGLGNVDNSSDLNKPVSTATQTALDLKLNRSDFPSGTNTGNILYWNGTSWVNLAPGQNGQALILVNGIPSWSTLSKPVIDIDLNIYNTVQIGTQVWMSENLKTTRYRNGGSIPNVTDNATWGNLTTGAWSYYNNADSNNAIYGKLYNWYTTLGDTLCPTGWGVPTDAEWTTLTNFLGGESVAGGKMKTIGNAYWNDPNTGADNTSGFSVLPGGYRNSLGSFFNIRDLAFFWSATEIDNDYAWNRTLYNNFGTVYRFSNSKSVGASVRCLRD